MTDVTTESAGAPPTAMYNATELPDTFAYNWLMPNAGGIAALALLPVALLVNVPLAGWAIAFTMWLLNRLGHAMVMSMVNGLPKAMAVGAAGFGMMLRVWIIGFVLFFTGAQLEAGDVKIGAGREDLAVPAMLLFLVIFTVDVFVRSMFELRRYKVGAADTPNEETSA